MSYTPTKAPAINDPMAQEIFKYITRELERIASAFEDQTDLVSFVVQHRAPTKLREGQFAFADGVDWNPGSGRGLYLYNDGAWEQVYATL